MKFIIIVFVHVDQNCERTIKTTHTADSGVGLDKQLSSFFPQQHRLPETQKVVSATVADSGVVVIQSSASFNICCRFKDLQQVESG